MLKASTLPLKRLFKIVNGSTPRSDNSSFWDGDLSWATPEDVSSAKNGVLDSTRRAITQSGYDNSGTTLVPAGSIILTTRAPIGNLALAGIELCTNQGCKSLVPLSSHVDSRYHYYQLLARSEDLQSLGNGTTFVELSTGNLGSFGLLAPDIESQIGIADFLDRETAKADALVAKYERLVELLEEKRSALITQAVTKGLDPSVPMKDSGIDWIGKIPTHWRIVPLRHVAGGITVGIVINPSSYYEDTGVPCLRSLNVTTHGIDPGDLVYISDRSNQLLRKSQVFAEDIVMVRTGRPGTSAVIRDGYDGANCVDLVIIRKSARYDSAFLSYYLNSSSAKVQYDLDSSGALQQHFNIGTAAAIKVPLPPLDEQMQISRDIERISAAISTSIDIVQRAIKICREHRAALVTAAVTGQVDVTTYRSSQVAAETVPV